MLLRPAFVVKFAALLATPLILSSCGGLASALEGTTSFQGTWTGSATGNGINGSMTLNINANNNVTGSDTISRAGVTTADTGTVSSNGNLNLVTATGGVNVANISAAVLVSSSNMSSTSGTIAVIGGTTTNFGLNLNTSSLLVHKQ